MNTTDPQKDQSLYTDDELCAVLRISKSTLRKILREGPARQRYRDAGDIRTIQRLTVGGQRRWVKTSVDEFINGNQKGE